jgi:hypothetical protein
MPCGLGLDRQDDESAEQPARCLSLRCAKSSHYLLDVDCRRCWHITGSTQRHDPCDRRSPPEEINQHSGIKNAKHGSPGATRIGTALFSHPSCGVGIPIMIVICDSTRGALDVAPPELLADCTLDGRTHECGPTPGAAQLINLSDELIVEFYVHSHVPSLAHNHVKAFAEKPEA